MIFFAGLVIFVGGFLLYLLLQGIMSRDLTVFLFMISMIAALVSGVALLLGWLVPKTGWASPAMFLIFAVSAITLVVIAKMQER